MTPSSRRRCIRRQQGGLGQADALADLVGLDAGLRLQKAENSAICLIQVNLLHE